MSGTASFTRPRISSSFSSRQSALPCSHGPQHRVRPVESSEQIPLAKPEIGEREEELVLEVLRSGRLSLGPVLERFEREFAEWLGVDDAVAVSSGTAALHLGVRQLGWGEGDEVVTSPFSFVASANCLLYEGVTPRFVDIDPVTLNLDPAAAADGGGGEHRRRPARRHLRLPRRAARAVRAGRVEGTRRARGRLRGARRGRCRRREARRSRPPRDLRLLCEQAAHDGGGRPDRPALLRRGRRAPLGPQPGPRDRHGLARPRPPRLQLPHDRRPGRARHRAGREGG